MDAVEGKREDRRVNRRLAAAGVPDGPVHVREAGDRRLYFGGSDYFRMSWDGRVRRFLAAGMLRAGGVAVSASRVTTGNLEVYTAAEVALARWLGMETAVLTGSGYLAPMVALQSLAGRCDGVVLAAGAHPCLTDAAAASGLPVEVVSGPDGVAGICRRRGWIRAVVVRDGLGALTGRVPGLGDWLAAVPAEGWLLVDDAHGIGTIGEGGRGVLGWEGIRDRRVLLAFTLSKALGLYGGCVCGPRWLAEAAWTGSGAARGGTPIPPAYAAAVPLVLGMLERGGARWRDRIRRHRECLLAALAGVEGAGGVDHVGAVVGVAAMETRRRRELVRALALAGISPPLIRYPGAPEGGLFRFALSSAHTVGMVGMLAEVLGRVCGGNPGGYRVM